MNLTRRYRNVKRKVCAPYFATKRFIALGRRGWHKTDAWNLGWVFAGRLGYQLLALAECGHSYPQHVGEQAWQEQLRLASAQLILYSDIDEELDEISMSDPDWIKKSRDLEATRTADAQAALRWVADHLPSLWD